MSGAERRLSVIRSHVNEPGAVRLVANRCVLDAIDRGDREFGVHSTGCNNSPELRRNLLLERLRKHGCKFVASESETSLHVAATAHDAVFIDFLATAYRRWATELQCDASYVQTGSDGSALVPFHCSKSATQRQDSVAAQFAAFGSDFETPLREDTASVLAADLGVVTESVRQFARGASVCYAITTHPGHHAGPSYYSGFCYVNNAAVARALLGQHLGGSVGVLDVDFHGGNGTYDCARECGFWFRSINCVRAYPFVDMDESGIELPAGSTWSGGYEAALTRALSELPAETKGLVVSLGYDTLGTDPESKKRANSGFDLIPSDFRRMAQKLKSLQIPLLVVQEGGYDMENLPAAALEFVGGLSG
eukprot:TRINITY_DN13279_c0_g1_i2.p1 TRINITY_DN13279_c0_g1~~TRINITY_DN13279_c0_g1_i2.p1  ORF type:complete len:392 (+),score=70.32 TRINITY_DN13279_c0_g1_i2:87-1178(+)